MLAIKSNEYKKYGCPNCGCDRSDPDDSNKGGVFEAICLHCNLHFAVFPDTITSMNCKVVYATGRRDKDGKEIREKPTLIEHPRKGMPFWHYESEDIRPEDIDGEYWQSGMLGYYYLSGIIKSKFAGLRILGVVKSITGKEHPKSFLDYKDNHPDLIHFKFYRDEFDLEKLHTMSKNLGDIITRELLNQCCICNLKEINHETSE